MLPFFGITAKEWKDLNTDKNGNMRDFATIEQLVVLSNLESINALLVSKNLSQESRLIELNKVAISQMKSLINNSNFKNIGN